jgi:AraC-like DNA-binding protein
MPALRPEQFGNVKFPRETKEVLLTQCVVEEALRHQPLLRGLVAAGAAYLPRHPGVLFHKSEASSRAVLLYCVKGGGWCEIAGHLRTIRSGELVVLPPGVPHTCAAQASIPWTVHCVHAAGVNVPHYLEALGVSARAPSLWVGEDMQLRRLFDEILEALERGPGFANLLQASHALGYLLASLIRRDERAPDSTDTAKKVAEAIIYMSEHLDEAPRVGNLARLANLSATHFSVLFKAQTGCSPRDYLHLLRIHHACQLLRDTSLQVKEIAARLGYRDPFHFSRQFKTFHGVSPSEFRESKIPSCGP